MRVGEDDWGATTMMGVMLVVVVVVVVVVAVAEARVCSFCSSCLVVAAVLPFPLVALLVCVLSSTDGCELPQPISAVSRQGHVVVNEV